ncbi:hypothetical protein JQ560_44820, partial [Bradyrhizobium liaoningense]|nr:hypothetical protein [Bradyrhizobium liaoningense]MBR1070335.1 hypothetical protein [Bradyrhizobium liaoningense]
MLALGLVLDTLGIGMLCWAIFALAVHALPFFVALNVGMIAFHGGAGLLGALLVGIGSGALMLVVGQFTLAASRSVISRILVAAAFSIRKRVFYRTGYARGWPRRRVTPGPSSV